MIRDLDELRGEMRLAQRLRIRDLFTGVTTREERRERIREAILQLKERTAAAREFERLYGMPVVIESTDSESTP